MQNNRLTMQYNINSMPMEVSDQLKISSGNQNEEPDEMYKPIVPPMSIKNLLRLKQQQEQLEKVNREQLKKEVLLKFNSQNILKLNILLVSNYDRSQFVAQDIKLFDKLFVLMFIQRKLSIKKIKMDLEELKKDPISIDTKLEQLLQQYIIGHSNKTTQQNMQFIFKTAMKFMRFKLMERKIIKHHFCHQQFYKYYFGETSEKLKIPLEDFYDPRNMNLKRTKKQTFNKKYILKTSLSKKFQDDLQQFLDVDIYRFYQSIADKRVLKLIDSAERQFIKLMKSKDLNQIEFDFIFDSKFKAIQKVLIENPQNKLPWSSFEIKQAIQQVKDIFATQQSLQQDKDQLTVTI